MYFSGNYWIMLSPWETKTLKGTLPSIYTPRKIHGWSLRILGPLEEEDHLNKKNIIFRVDSIIFGGCTHNFPDFPCTNWCSTCWSIFTKQLQGFTMNDPDIKGMHSYMLAEHHLGTGKGTLRGPSCWWCRWFFVYLYLEPETSMY